MIMNQEALENRVVRLEVKTDNHEDDIKELRNSASKLSEAMASIEKNLSQIKYIAVGALTVVIGQTLGLDHTIKLFLGG
jgi:uncharacterized coiled-coil protein SlyX